MFNKKHSISTEKKVLVYINQTSPEKNPKTVLLKDSNLTLIAILYKL